MRIPVVPCLILLVVTISCQHTPEVPRPRAYPRIEYPEHALQTFTLSDCPFTFEYPQYAEINRKDDHPCWFDLYMPVFKSRLHCSYIAVDSAGEFEDLVNDVFSIAEKINARANYMEESPIHNEHGVGGLSLTWTGPAASPLHFFLTDTTQHFFKASLYFEAEVKPDSLAPIVEFVKKDIHQMIRTFQWKKD